jgi:hypothetical protein
MLEWLDGPHDLAQLIGKQVKRVRCVLDNSGYPEVRVSFTDDTVLHVYETRQCGYIAVNVDGVVVVDR